MHPPALRKVLPATSRYVGLALTGGMEEFCDEIEAAAAAGALGRATHRAISRRYGISWLANRGLVETSAETPTKLSPAAFPAR